MVDSKGDERQNDKEHDDDYRYHVIFLSHGELCVREVFGLRRVVCVMSALEMGLM